MQDAAPDTTAARREAAREARKQRQAQQAETPTDDRFGFNQRREQYNQPRDRQPEKERTDYSVPPKSKKAKGLLWRVFGIIISGGCLVGGLCSLKNTYTIYDNVFTQWGVHLPPTACKGLEPIPFVGGWLDEGCTTVFVTTSAAASVAAVATVTAFLSIPVLINLDPGAIEGLIFHLRRKKDSHKTLEGRTGDTEEIQGLIKRHAAIPQSALVFFYIMGGVAMLADLYLIGVYHKWHLTFLNILWDALGFELILAGWLKYRAVIAPTPTEDRR